MKKKINNNGYIALIALIVVASAGLAIGLAISLNSIGEIQSSFGSIQANRAKILAQTCTEWGLEKLRLNWADYSEVLSFASDSCIINIEVNSGQAGLSAEGKVDIYNQKIQVQVDNDLNIISWQEH
jgi:hypothetical protein